MNDDTWNRTCKTEHCHGVARGDSDYCNICRKERKLNGLEVKRCKKI